jgi:threonyl-tRNA synthetase
MIDHRKLGRELELFATDPLIGAGLPIWLPDGAVARHAVEEYLRRLEAAAGYQHVYSPPMARRELYEISGHWAHFAEDMFPPMRDGAEELVLRPSLCPHHALVYRSRQRSFRDLPLRVAELGGMYRAERSGVLGGLARVRAISLNDAHIFCQLDRAGDEVSQVFAMMHRAHKALGVVPARFRLSLRGAGREYGGEPEQWELAERILRDALAGLSYVDAPGEAAFYGPKVDVQIVDPAGRESTLATYMDSSGAAVRPVMIHRSLAGSMERLFGHLVEVHGGAFPAWYAPVQVVVLPVGADQAAAAGRFADDCAAAGLRVKLAADGSLGARVRDARRVPYLAVIGAREAAAGAVSLRPRADIVDGAGPPAGSEVAVAEAIRLMVGASAMP